MFEPVSKRDQGETDETETNETQGETVAPPLTLSENSKVSGEGRPGEEAGKAGWGRSGKCPGYSLNARRKILRAGGAIDKIASNPGECLFLTGTLPGGTEAAKKAIAEWSGYAIHGVQAWLNHFIPNKLLIYCWEFQKRGALHLHLTVVCQDSAISQYIIDNWKAQWARMIDGITARSGVNCWERLDGFDYSDGRKDVLQTDAQRCNTSAAAYLSKYLSKGNLEGNYQGSREYHPSRYWGVSRPLNQLVESMTQDLEIEVTESSRAEELYEELMKTVDDLSQPRYSYTHDLSGAKVTVYYSQREDKEELWDSLKRKCLEATRFSWQSGELVKDLRSFRVGTLKEALKNWSLLAPVPFSARTSLTDILNKTGWLTQLIYSEVKTASVMATLLSAHVLAAGKTILPRRLTSHLSMIDGGAI